MIVTDSTNWQYRAPPEQMGVVKCGLAYGTEWIDDVSRPLEGLGRYDVLCKKTNPLKERNHGFVISQISIDWFLCSTSCSCVMRFVNKYNREEIMAADDLAPNRRHDIYIQHDDVNMRTVGVYQECRPLIMWCSYRYNCYRACHYSGNAKAIFI